MTIVLDLPPLLAYLVAIEARHTHNQVVIVEHSEVYPISGTNTLNLDYLLRQQLEGFLQLPSVMKLSKVIIENTSLNYEVYNNRQSMDMVGIVYDLNYIVEWLRLQLSATANVQFISYYEGIKYDPKILIIKSINQGLFSLEYLFMKQQPIIWLPLISNNTISYSIIKTPTSIVVNHNVIHFDLVNTIKLAQVILAEVVRPKL